MLRQIRKPRTRANRAAAAVTAAALTLTLVAARTLTVDDDGPAEFRAIQNAIDAAAPGDLVAVAAGSYRENLRMMSGVAVVGAGPSVTTVDGGRLESVARLIDCDSSTRLEGFRLTGGQAGVGAGVRVEGGAPIVRFNEIVGNVGVYGGSVLYSYGGGVALRHSGGVVSDNVLSGNEADYGGGLHLEGGAPRITRNVIAGNTAGAGGGVDAYVIFGADAVITANTIASNTAIFGGGIKLGGPGLPMVTSNLILGNTAAGSGAGNAFGGGADAYYSNARIAGNTFARNIARTGGGAAILSDGAPRLAGNIFSQNDASSVGGAVDLEAPQAVVLGNLFYLNARGTCDGGNASLCSEPSNVEADPLFVDPETGDFRLRPGSPAIDSAPAEDAPAEDLRGQRRPLDGDIDGAAAQDRGALEYDRDAVMGLRFTSGSALSSPPLTWDPVSGAERYHVYSAAFTGGPHPPPGSCRDAEDADTADRMFLDPLNPLPGEVFAYFVTAVIAGVERSPGFDSLGVERTLPFPCP